MPPETQAGQVVQPPAQNEPEQPTRFGAAEPKGAEDIDADAEDPETAEPADKTIDLLSEEAGDVDWIKAREDFLEAKKKTSFSVDPKTIESAPEAVKDAFFNLRKMALDRTREAAAEKKAIAAERVKVAQDRAAVLAERKALYEGLAGHEKLKPAAPAPGSPEAAKAAEPEQFSPEWFDWKVNQAADAKFTEWSERLSGATQDLAAKAQAAQADVDRTAALDRLEQFADAHPDFWTFEQDMKDLRTKHPTMAVEEAYEFARARKPVAPTENAPTLEDKRRAAQEATGRGGSPGSLRPKIPQFESTADYLEWLESHPEAAAAEEKRFAQRGLSY